MSEQEIINAIREAHDIAYKAPELNLGNYTHDQVCELNDAVCEEIQRWMNKFYEVQQ